MMNKITKKTIFSGIFGHALECYDFSVYAFFSPILATIFFPNYDLRISLLLTFSVFALSFLVRPFGGIVFGYLGDHFGRKKALVVSIIVMSVPTFLLGLLPSYATIGIGAPILLTLLRLAQGIAVSGEMTTATTYLVEHASNKHRGFIGSLAMASACGGSAVSSAIVVLITASVTYEQLLSWGWRLPFLVGGILGLVGLFTRLRSHETLPYQTAKKNAEKMITPSIFKHYSHLQYKPILIATLLTGIMPMSYYFFIGYFNAFLIKTMGQPAKKIMLINFICQLFLTILLPVLGIISDKKGRKPMLMVGMVGLILLIHPIFWLLQQQAISAIFLGEFLFVLIIAPIVAIIPITLAEMFHVQSRNSSISLGYNMSQAIFGGTAPLIALGLTASTQNLYAPAWYLLAGAGLSLLTLLKIKESYQQPLT
ncbi:MFS transporter [soil metagenome]